MYIFGGMSSGGENDKLWKFDVKRRTWTVVATGTHLNDCGMAVLTSGKISILLGEDAGTNTYKTGFVYTPPTSAARRGLRAISGAEEDSPNAHQDATGVLAHLQKHVAEHGEEMGMDPGAEHGEEMGVDPGVVEQEDYLGVEEVRDHGATGESGHLATPRRPEKSRPRRLSSPAALSSVTWAHPSSVTVTRGQMASAQLDAGNEVFFFGGKNWGTLFVGQSDQFLRVTLDPATGNVMNATAVAHCPTVAGFCWANPLCYAGAVFQMSNLKVSFAGSEFVLFGGERDGHPTSEFYTFSVFGADPSSTKCSVGYRKTGSGSSTKCEVCPAGTVGTDGVSCQNCPAGTSSAAVGVASSMGCGYCLAGTYSGSSGATSCTPCSSVAACPIGSTTSTGIARRVSEEVASWSTTSAEQSMIREDGVVDVSTAMSPSTLFVKDHSTSEDQDESRRKLQSTTSTCAASTSTGASSVSTSQPVSFETNEETVKEIQFVSVIVGVALLCLVLTTVIACYLIKGGDFVRRKFKTLDLLFRNVLRDEDGDPNPTAFGGIMTILAVIGVLALGAHLILTVLADAVREEKSLLPSLAGSTILTKDAVKSEDIGHNVQNAFTLTANISYSGYRRSCTADGLVGTRACHGLVMVKNPFACTEGSVASFQCEKTAWGCSLLWTCSNCEYGVGASKVVETSMGEAGASASAITVALTSLSSIPSAEESGIESDYAPQPSSVVTHLSPELGKMFKGSAPSEVTVTGLPSIYTFGLSVPYDVIATGMHIDYASKKLGSEVTGRDISFVEGLKVLFFNFKVDFQISWRDSIFRFQRRDRTTSMENGACCIMIDVNITDNLYHIHPHVVV